MSAILKITSPSFEDGGNIPKKHTGFGENISPAFSIENLSDNTVSVVIMLNDLDIPFISEYNHWLIWNIPASAQIPENISYGAEVQSPAGAVQGIGYGKNRYRGPQQPVFVRSVHRYVFNFYILDSFLKLESTSRRNDVLKAMECHILQKGSIMGKYKR